MNSTETNPRLGLLGFVYVVTKLGVPFFFIFFVVLTSSFIAELMRGGSFHDAYWWSIGQSPTLAITTAILFVFTLTYLALKNPQRTRQVAQALLHITQEGICRLNNLLLGLGFVGIGAESPEDDQTEETDRPEMGK